MNKSIKIAVIGGGSIGGAVAFGLRKAGFDNVVVTARHRETLGKFEAEGIQTSLDNAEAASGADIVIFAVKPFQMEAALKDTLELSGGEGLLSAEPGKFGKRFGGKEALPAEPGKFEERPSGKETLRAGSRIVVSMAPAVTAEQLRRWAPEGEALACVVPNTAAEVRESMTFISPISLSAAQSAVLEEVFGSIGSVLTVPADKMGAGVALASCGIAYALRYIRAASEGGVELGLPAADSTLVVAQTVKGAASLLEAHGTHPEQEIDKVTTPGGMTIKGLNAMEEGGFTSAVIKGLKACLE